MATNKAGKVDSIFDLKKIEAEYEAVKKTLAAAVADIAKTQATIKGADSTTGLKGGVADYQRQSQQVKQLTADEAKLRVEREYLTRQAKLQAAAESTVLGAYKNLSAQLEIARQKAKDLAIQYGKNSDEAKKAAASVQEMDKRLKEVDASLGQHQRNVGNYSSVLSGFKAGWAALGGVVAGAAGVFAFAKEAIGSTSATANQLKVEMTGLKFGWESVLRTFATGDFSNLLNNMDEAIARGREYQKTLIAIERAGRALRIQESEERVTIEQLKTIQRDPSRSKDERIAAGKEALRLEEEELVKRVGLAKRRLDNEIKTAEMETGLHQQTIKNYLKEADANEGRIKTAKKYLDAETELAGIQKMTGQEQAANINRINELNKIIKETPGHVKAYATIVQGMGKSNKETMQKVEESWVAVGNEQASFETATRRIKVTLGRLNKGIIDDAIKESEETIKATEKKKDSLQLLNEEVGKLTSALNDQIAAGDKDSATTAALILQKQKLIDKQKELTDAVMASAAFQAAQGVIRPTTPGTATFGDEYTAPQFVGPQQGTTPETNTTIAGPVMPDLLTQELAYMDYYNSLAELRAKDIEDQKAHDMAIVQSATGLLNELGSLANQIFENKIAQIDAESEKDAEARDLALEKAKGNKRQEDKINADFAKKEKERDKERKKAQREQAELQKAIAIMNTIINTAVAVIGMMANPGGPAGVVLSILAALTGAASIATVLATPLPAARHGIKNAPGGIMRVSEEGQELYTGPSGTFLTPEKESLMYVEPGASIIPHSELMATGAILSDRRRFGSTDSDSVLADVMVAGFGHVARTVKDKQETHFHWDNGQLRTAIKNGNNYIQYVNDRRL